MFVCCACCVLSGRGLYDELITRPDDSTDCGASLYVINNPRERGGHIPRWAAEPDKIIICSVCQLLTRRQVSNKSEKMLEHNDDGLIHVIVLTPVKNEILWERVG
jgi:hypothetical protein